jgi:hypothetical protein
VNTCSNCKHWATEFWGGKHCALAETHSYLQNNKTRAWADLVSAPDEYGYNAVLYTEADFGCNQFEQ